MRAAVLILVSVLFLAGPARASDVPAGAPLPDRAAADAVCPGVCKANDCGWSGEWKTAADGKGAMCDCGTERIRFVPGGQFTDDAGAMAACLETCVYNGDVYSGKWEHRPGLFSMCGCRVVADYCPGAHEGK